MEGSYDALRTLSILRGYVSPGNRRLCGNVSDNHSRAPAAQAQTYSVLHYFTGGLDGGTTEGGGNMGSGCSDYGCGVVWELAGVTGDPQH